jgi:hypothetical protein
VLRDANSIGTTYLRASLLPAEHTDAVRSALRQYIDARLAFSDAGTEREAVARAEASAAKLQAEVWNHATAAGKEAPTPMTAAFVLSLNETIDLDAMRLHALREHVPGAVWLLVLAVAICGCWTSSYGAGSTGARSGFTNVALPIVIAVVITLVADLDRPRSGLIRISQQPMLDLQASFAQRQPASQR